MGEPGDQQQAASALGAEVQRVRVDGRAVTLFDRPLVEDVDVERAAPQRVQPQRDTAARCAAARVHQRELLDLAERANELGWWQAHAGQLSDEAQTVIALEEEATKITNFELILIPGLLQTAEYARDIIQASKFDEQPRNIEAKVAARMARRSVLTRPDPPELEAILDEGALRRFRDPQIMRRQLHQLIDAASRPNITLRVIPFAAGHHASAEGPCMLFEFDDGPGIVHLEGKISSFFLEDPYEIDTYQETVRRLLHVALKPSASIELVKDIIKELPGTDPKLCGGDLATAQVIPTASSVLPSLSRQYRPARLQEP